MTAEVVILNKTAAALAADSKGTVRVGDIVKTHDNLNKLFTLSKYHPVGVMFYGNSEVIDVPWETVVKVYRDKLRNLSFKKLNHYAGDFMFSLVHDYMSSDQQQRDNVYWISRDFFDGVLDRAASLRAETRVAGNVISETEAVETARNIWWHVIESSRVLYGFHRITSQEIRSKYERELLRAYEDTFDELETSTETRDGLVGAACEALRREQFSSLASGLVFAGFGDEEIFPSMKAYTVDGVVAGNMRGAIIEKTKISNQITATIRPFAQNDMVVRFMEGIDPDYRIYLQNVFRTLSTDMMSAIIDKYGRGDRKAKAGLKNNLSNLVQEMIDDMIRDASEYRREFFVAPITSMAQMLPKEDLAHLAESLVNLTSLKRRMSLDEESVGGPIDVAVISKGDGFVWIKRKHYFDADLNKTFMMNYFRQHLDAEGETGHDRQAKRRQAAGKTTRSANPEGRPSRGRILRPAGPKR